MAIENKNLFITKEEFKDSSFYDEDLFGDKNSPNEATNDKTIDLAIDMASNNIDYLSGFSITEKWPEDPETAWTQNIKLATAHYVRYALTKGVDYIRGQQSLSISGISESINNPEDPYFIPPDVFNYLRKAKEYRSFKGYELAGVTPNRSQSLFSKFGSNCAEDSPWNRYLKIVNLLQGEGIIINVTHPPNILGPVVTISFDKSLIPDITGFETKADHKIDIDNLQTQINTKANKSDIPDISNLATKEELSKKEDILTAKRLMEFFESDEFYINEGNTKIGNGPWGEESILNKTITRDVSYKDLVTKDKTLLGSINEIASTGGGDVTKDDLVIIYDNSKLNPEMAKEGLTLSMNKGQFQNLKEPTSEYNVTTKKYVDEKISTSGTWNEIIFDFSASLQARPQYQNINNIITNNGTYKAVMATCVVSQSGNPPIIYDKVTTEIIFKIEDNTSRGNILALPINCLLSFNNGTISCSGDSNWSGSNLSSVVIKVYKKQDVFL